MLAKSRKDRPRKPARFLVRPLFAALVAAGIAVPAHGATIVVTTGGDGGTGSTCTLRQAIASLNGGALVDGCTLASGSFGTNDTVDLSLRSGTIGLAGTALPVDVSMSISGPGATSLTISGSNASRVFEVGINPNLVLSIEQVTVANGRSVGPGGCVYAAVYNGVELWGAVVTGCRTTDDPNPALSPVNAFGGGVFAYTVLAGNSTISGNTSQASGGGVMGAIVSMQNTVVTGNTVLGERVSSDTIEQSEWQKYILAGMLGGGGIASFGAVDLAYTVVSNNVVHASTITGTSLIDDQPTAYEARIGTGGGVLSFQYKYGDSGNYDDAKAFGKAGTIGGARTILPRLTPAKIAAFRAAAADRFAAAQLKSAAPKVGARAKSDLYHGLELYSTTISGNQVVGGGAVPGAIVVGKYSGGGAAFASSGYDAFVGNSTVSGNRIPTVNALCAEPAGGPPAPGSVTAVSCGAGLAGDSAKIFNSTVTGNVGPTAVEFKYTLPAPSSSTSAKVAKFADAHPALHSAWVRAQANRSGQKSGAKAFAKSNGPSDLLSTIVAANVGTFDIGCFGDPCTLLGFGNLVGGADPGVTLPFGTLSGNPQLAPLANRGGMVAGAPGVAGTGPTPTHALYVGSPAVDTGNNEYGWDYEQRGPGFPRTVGIETDIGAYEGTVPRLVAAAAPVPALGPWMLGLLSALLGLLGFARRRRTP